MKFCILFYDSPLFEPTIKGQKDLKLFEGLPQGKTPYSYNFFTLLFF